MTEREIEILKLRVQGLTRREIAEKLDISMFTVKNHLANMRRTTGCSTTVQLIEYALSQRIVTPSAVGRRAR